MNEDLPLKSPRRGTEVRVQPCLLALLPQTRIYSYPRLPYDRRKI
jgi:hypothetical protein